MNSLIREACGALMQGAGTHPSAAFATVTGDRTLEYHIVADPRTSAYQKVGLDDSGQPESLSDVDAETRVYSWGRRGKLNTGERFAGLHAEPPLGFMLPILGNYWGRWFDNLVMTSAQRIAGDYVVELSGHKRPDAWGRMTISSQLGRVIEYEDAFSHWSLDYYRFDDYHRIVALESWRAAEQDFG